MLLQVMFWKPALSVKSIVPHQWHGVMQHDHWTLKIVGWTLARMNRSEYVWRYLQGLVVFEGSDSAKDAAICIAIA